MNAVAPGPVPTELFLKGKSSDRIKELKNMPPLERLGQPEDIAGVVSFLAGPEGGWVNSQVIRANDRAEWMFRNQRSHYRSAAICLAPTHIKKTIEPIYRKV